MQLLLNFACFPKWDQLSKAELKGSVGSARTDVETVLAKCLSPIVKDRPRFLNIIPILELATAREAAAAKEKQNALDCSASAALSDPFMGGILHRSDAMDTS